MRCDEMTATSRNMHEPLGEPVPSLGGKEEGEEVKGSKKQSDKYLFIFVGGSKRDGQAACLEFDNTAHCEVGWWCICWWKTRSVSISPDLVRQSVWDGPGAVAKEGEARRKQP